MEKTNTKQVDEIINKLLEELNFNLSKKGKLVGDMGLDTYNKEVERQIKFLRDLIREKKNLEKYETSKERESLGEKLDQLDEKIGSLGTELDVIDSKIDEDTELIQGTNADIKRRLADLEENENKDLLIKIKSDDDLEHIAAKKAFGVLRNHGVEGVFVAYSENTYYVGISHYSLPKRVEGKKLSEQFPKLYKIIVSYLRGTIEELEPETKDNVEITLGRTSIKELVKDKAVDLVVDAIDWEKEKEASELRDEESLSKGGKKELKATEEKESQKKKLIRKD